MESARNEISKSLPKEMKSSLHKDASVQGQHCLQLNDNKAGMEGLDKEKINGIIYEASKGSKFYENEKRKEEKVALRVHSMMMELSKYTAAEKHNSLRKSDELFKLLAERMDLSRQFVHIDMDAFYAAVEMRENPELKTIPMAVGSNAMLSTSNYLARRYGVRAAMPGFIAKKLCPQLVIVPMHFGLYKQVSSTIQSIFKDYDPNYAAMSLDEAYLDLTDYIEDNSFKYTFDETGTDLVEVIVEEIRNKIFKETQLTASAGIAPNMMLSKISSDMNKPNGQFYLKANQQTIREFMKDLPIRKVFGIGKVTEQVLKALNVTKCGDLYENRSQLCLLFSESTFRYFMQVVLGISSNRIEHSARKSLSAERTFQDISNKEQLLRICKELCKQVVSDLKKESLLGRTISIKYKLSSFVCRTRAKTVPNPISTFDELFANAKDLLLFEMGKTNDFVLRLLGVRICQFENGKVSRKQKTVETCFQNVKVSREIREVVCPICMIAQSINEADKHIDKCLLRVETESKVKPIAIESDSVCAGNVAVGDNYECPVCNKHVCGEINSHIDECLSKKAIRNIVQQGSQFEINTGKVKKRKNVETHKTSKCKKTIYSFFTS